MSYSGLIMQSISEISLLCILSQIGLVSILQFFYIFIHSLKKFYKMLKYDFILGILWVLLGMIKV